MNELVIIIIDDEPKARIGLRDYINFIFEENKFEFHLCNSVNEGVIAIEKYFPDLVFLDIEMPEVSGFGLFNRVKRDSFEVVFVTAYAQYIEKAVNEIGCFGYLNKPIERNKLKRIFERLNEKSQDKKYFKFVNSVHKNRVMVDLSEIVYCKAADNYCELFMNDGKTKYLLSKTLKSLEEKLNQSFFHRIHRSFILNVNYVEGLNNDTSQIILNHNHEALLKQLPVSEGYIKKIKEFFL